MLSLWFVGWPALAQDWQYRCDHAYCGVSLDRLLEAPQVWVAELEAIDVNSTLPFVDRSVSTLYIQEVLRGGVSSDRIGLGRVEGRPHGSELGTRVLAFAQPMTIPVCADGACVDVVVGDVAVPADPVLQPLLWEGPEGQIRAAMGWAIQLCFNGEDFNHKSVAPGTSCSPDYDRGFEDLVRALRERASGDLGDGVVLPGLDAVPH